MSLLDEAMEDCQMLDRITADDGYGGFVPSWSGGASFKAAIVRDDSMSAMQAMSSGVTAVYTITTGRNVTLDFHDVFKRLSDGQVFRVKTRRGNFAGVQTPSSAGLNMRQVRAEEWSLVNGNE